MTMTDFDPAKFPTFLRRDTPSAPEAAPRAVAVEPPAADRPFAALERFVAEDRRQTETKRNRLKEIASLVNALTYGEMIELASALWSLKPDGEISQEMLPGMLHKWSTGR